MPANSTRARRPRKAKVDRPPKPYKGFPLGPHASGAWCKKIRGKIIYFGKWGRVRIGKLERLHDDGWKAALALYEQQKDALYAGLTPRGPGDDRPTLGDLCNRFLTAKQRKLDAGEIGRRMFDEYKATTDRLIARFGKERLVADLAPPEFEALRADLAKAFGPVRLGNEIQKVRTVFKYGEETGLVKTRVVYGPEFKKPGKNVMRKHRAANGERMLEPGELRKLIDAAPTPLRAMILLGVNCGLGNHDIAMLPLKALNLDKGWLRFPRPKTGIERRCPLWTETIEALKVTLADRSKPKSASAADKVFVSDRGHEWLSRGIANPVSVAARKLMKSVGIDRPGIGFYTLRHTFRTVADATRDFPAVRLIMGHADGSIDEVYREHIDDSRLRAVADCVRTWLFGAAEGGTR